MSWLNHITRTEHDWATAVLRWTLALVIFPHGAQKTLGWFGGGGFSAAIDGLGGLGVPAFVAILVILGEFLGPLGLAVGFLSRIAAGGLFVIMTGAIWMAHLPYGFFMNWYGQQQGEGFEYHLLVLGIAVAIMIRGSGAFSLDRRLGQNA